jgi:PAS domain S-box-containing protein
VVGGALLLGAAQTASIDAVEMLGMGAAAVLGAALGRSRVLEELRERTNPRHLLEDDRSRVLAAIDTYADFFDSASDGMIVVDSEATVLHINRAGELLTGWARDGLVGRSLLDIVKEPYKKSLLGVARDAAHGTAYSAFDVDLLTTSGDPIIASLATSSVLAGVGAAVLSFRDVTLERALQNELRTTKDFLERLIDSTIDAIVAADTDGTIIVFNQGAERIYGYPAEDVVGKMSVKKLYAPHVAGEVMRMLRSEDYGGVGRLEGVRQMIVTASGKTVPVMLSAAIVYEEQEEVATVGIFSDLRERITMEAHLVEAREKLVIQEKQAVVAELAGTTAHELNQPLTSVMGYAELLRRRLPAGSPNLRAVETILREAERMAEIVRKIGKITRYETKAYVGETRILDLDRSSEDRERSE